MIFFVSVFCIVLLSITNLSPKIRNLFFKCYAMDGGWIYGSAQISVTKVYGQKVLML